MVFSAFLISSTTLFMLNFMYAQNKHGSQLMKDAVTKKHCWYKQKCFSTKYLQTTEFSASNYHWWKSDQFILHSSINRHHQVCFYLYLWLLHNNYYSWRWQKHVFNVMSVFSKCGQSSHSLVIFVQCYILEIWLKYDLYHECIFCSFIFMPSGPIVIRRLSTWTF